MGVFSCTIVVGLLDVLFLIVSVTNVNAQAGTYCLTPADRPGECISIRQCDILLQLLRTRSQDPVTIEYLRSSGCGYRGQDPLVCCPVNAPNTAPPTRPPPVTDSPRPLPIPTAPPPAFRTTPTEAPPPPPVTQGNNYNSILPQKPFCGNQHTVNASNERIVGGRPALLGEFPWIVALGYRNSRNQNLPKWLCGGSLITSKHVLTAGHCVSRRNDLYVVRAGDLDLYSTDDGAQPQDVAIAKVKLHEGYNPTSVSNDIALITLVRTVTGPLIEPVCLPSEPNLRALNFAGYHPIVSGWGALHFNGPSSSHLQAVMLPVVRNTECQRAFSGFKNVIIDNRVLCAGLVTGKKDSCQGDSGGPLIYAKTVEGQETFYQIGVVSYGFRCAEEGYYGVYTRVTEFLDWIQNNLE